eukprot:3141888-Amphidinium_carterae.1
MLQCRDASSPLVMWNELFELAQFWTASAKDEDADFLERELVQQTLPAIKHMSTVVLRSPDAHERGVEECPLGVAFVALVQLIVTASRFTQHLPAFSESVNLLLETVSLEWVARSGWPIFVLLAVFEDLTKGYFFFRGDRKYKRGYGDWDMRSDELSPIYVAQEHAFMSPSWKQVISAETQRLMSLSQDMFVLSLEQHAQRREQEHGVRSVVQSLYKAIAQLARLSHPGKRRFAYVVLLYGAEWAKVLRRKVHRMEQLHMHHVLFVVAIGKAASETCSDLHESAAHPVVCWNAESQSQVHRFTAISALLHVGVDVLYLDMDTFLVRDPTDYIVSRAAEHNLDALFARHADGDCASFTFEQALERPCGCHNSWLGIMITALKSTSEGFKSSWVCHPRTAAAAAAGEIECFWGDDDEEVSVAWVPHDLVKISADTLEDVNEFVISSIGWHGHITQLM